MNTQGYSVVNALDPHSVFSAVYHDCVYIICSGIAPSNLLVTNHNHFPRHYLQAGGIPTSESPQAMDYLLSNTPCPVYALHVHLVSRPTLVEATPHSRGEVLGPSTMLLNYVM